MRNNNAKFNYIFAISMIILSAIISYVSSKYLDGIAVKFLAISIIAFLTAFIVNKFQITIYLIFASVALVYFDGYGQVLHPHGTSSENQRVHLLLKHQLPLCTEAK